MDNRPIGVFDSGFGGLTVLKALSEQLVDEDFIYFGDTLRVPYGNKSTEEVIKYSTEICRYLVNLDVKAIVVACNTSSSLALNYLSNRFDVPVIGMIDSGIDTLMEFSEKQKNYSKVGILGTRNTILSRAHEKGLKEYGFKGRIFPISCPLFVPIIEECVFDEKIWQSVFDFYLEILLNYHLDAVLLACTHYPLIKDLLQNYLGYKVQLLDPNNFVVSHVKWLMENKSIKNSTHADRYINFKVTGSWGNFTSFLKAFSFFSADAVQLVSLDELRQYET